MRECPLAAVSTRSSRVRTLARASHSRPEAISEMTGACEQSGTPAHASQRGGGRICWMKQVLGALWRESGRRVDRTQQCCRLFPAHLTRAGTCSTTRHCPKEARRPIRSDLSSRRKRASAKINFSFVRSFVLRRSSHLPISKNRAQKTNASTVCFFISSTLKMATRSIALLALALPILVSASCPLGQAVTQLGGACVPCPVDGGYQIGSGGVCTVIVPAQNFNIAVNQGTPSLGGSFAIPGGP